MQLSRGYRKSFNRLIARRKDRRKAVQKKPNKGLAGRAPFAEWFKTEDVKKLAVSDRLIDFGHFGEAYSGHIQFKDGSINRIAAKVFYEKLSDQEAARYNRKISDLAIAGIPIPKMGMVKWMNPQTGKTEWVLVSQLFGTASNKKIRRADLLDVIKDPRTTPAELERFADIYARFISLGYILPVDCLEYIETKHGTKLMPFDIDLLKRFSHKTEIAKAFKDLRKNAKLVRNAIIFTEQVLARIHPKLRH